MKPVCPKDAFTVISLIADVTPKEMSYRAFKAIPILLPPQGILGEIAALTGSPGDNVVPLAWFINEALPRYET